MRNIMTARNGKLTALLCIIVCLVSTVTADDHRYLQTTGTDPPGAANGKVFIPFNITSSPVAES